MLGRGDAFRRFIPPLLTTAEVAHILGTSKRNVRMIEMRAMRKIFKWLRCDEELREAYDELLATRRTTSRISGRRCGRVSVRAVKPSSTIPREIEKNYVSS